MERVVTSDEMRACDRLAIGTLKIPGLALMENAGRGVADAVRRRFGPLDGRRILVLCGKGNNGGDGFVAARHLGQDNAVVEAVLIGRPGDLAGDARVNYRAFRSIAARSGGRLKVSHASSARGLRGLRTPDIAIDALTGTGFLGTLKEPYASAVRYLNTLAAPKVSIDIPSGVDADTGRVANVAVRADLTVTMALKKIGLVVGAGRGCAGQVEVVDISLPTALLPSARRSVRLVGPDDIVLPRRPFDAHKHSVGKLFVLAGSPGLTGAAAMVATSAMRAGAGAVILGAPESVYPILARKLTEVMVEPLPAAPSGALGLVSLERIKEKIAWCDRMVIGPGLSRADDTVELIWKIVASAQKPMVIDADALNALALNPAILLKRRAGQVIATPHAGELARLLGISAAEVEADRLGLARMFARKFRLTLVSKGAPSLTALSSGDVYVNTSGNPGLATAGAGDVLAGVIAALWGQGMSEEASAYAGIYLHGLAGDLAKAEYGEKGMVAMDICEMLPNAFRKVEEGA